MFSVLKLVWQPDPFQSPLTGLGSKSIVNPCFSAILTNKYLATHKWSPDSIPSHGPIWNSHCPGATSAFIPEILIPAIKHACKCSSAIFLPNAFSAPALQ